MIFKQRILMEEANGGDGTLMGGSGSSTTEIPSGGMSVNGEVVTSWRDSLPDDLKNDPGLSTVTDVNALAKMYINSQKLIGKDKVVIPDKHATEDDWNNFYKKIGLPESLDKYEVKGPKDSKYVGAEALSELKPLAHKLGIMPKQLEGILEWYEGRSGKLMSSLDDAKKQDIAKGVASLKQEFGQAFETKLNYATRLIEENEVDGIGALMQDPSFGNNPVLVKLLSKIGEKLYKESDLREGDSGKFKHSPSEAQEKINLIQGNFEHPYHNSEHPNHENAVKEMQSLFEQAFGE